MNYDHTYEEIEIEYDSTDAMCGDGRLEQDTIITRVTIAGVDVSVELLPDALIDVLVDRVRG